MYRDAADSLSLPLFLSLSLCLRVRIVYIVQHFHWRGKRFKIALVSFEKIWCVTALRERETEPDRERDRDTERQRQRERVSE